MAVAYVTVQGASAGAASSVSTPSITPSGSDRLLVAFGGNEDGTPAAYSDMTYASGAMTPKWNVTYQTFYRNVCEFLVAPSTGGGVVTYTIGASNYTICAAALAFSGVDQTTPLDTESSNSAAAGDGATSVTISSATDDMCVDWFYGSSTTIAVEAGQDLRFESESFGAGPSPDVDCCGTSTEAGATSVTMGWTRADTTYGAGQVAVNINAVGAAPSTTRGTPFGHRGTAFNGGRTFHGIIQ